jgi:exodeoxyribonuclease VII large subunit
LESGIRAQGLEVEIVHPITLLARALSRRWRGKRWPTDLFGEVAEPPKRGPQVYSVGEITRAVRNVLEESLGTLWVEGEVSNYRQQSSGHQYFTLKDGQAQLSCVMFARPGLWRKQIPLSDGMCVQVRGALTVYEARGQYQLNVQLVQACGEGLLQAKFEALKRKLDSEGLFEAERKQALPIFPRAVAIVTSPTGAALRDMLHILTRRAPWLRVIIAPARVQGEGAAVEIAEALANLNELAARGELPIDVVVLARGGGSAEDLWQFNDEQLARAIAASQIPVVSAVGHEIDFTISDFVADLRAPTPSAAAELIAPETNEVLRRLRGFAARLHREVSGCVGRQKSRIEVLARARLFGEPRHRFADAAQRIDGASEALRQALRTRTEVEQRRIEKLRGVLREHRPDQQIALRRQQVNGLQRRLAERVQQLVALRIQELRRVSQMLRVLSPEATLERGYTITTDERGALLTAAAEVSGGMKLQTRFRDGSVSSTVPRERKSSGSGG